MKLIRSWPFTVPEGRSHVVDDIPRLMMGEETPNFDYRCLLTVDDDVVLIEWDIAIGGEELARFMQRAKDDPTRVRCAPYVLYSDDNATRPFYVHRIRKGREKRWVKGPEDTHCQMFGFGLVYLPAVLVRRFAETLQPGDLFSDTTFSRWHMTAVPDPNVPIDWDCHAIHLHYRTPEVPNGDVARSGRDARVDRRNRRR